MSSAGGEAFLPAIRRARIGQLNIYEVSEQELLLLERGSAESLFLNFAVFLLSSGLSFLISLLTTDITSPRLFTVLLVITTLSLIVGLLLGALWWWHRRSRSTIFEEIRRRMPPEGIPTASSVVVEN